MAAAFLTHILMFSAFTYIVIVHCHTGSICCLVDLVHVYENLTCSLTASSVSDDDADADCDDDDSHICVQVIQML